MILRVRPTPTRFPTKCLYTPVDNIPLHSVSSVWANVDVVHGACSLETSKMKSLAAFGVIPKHR